MSSIKEAFVILNEKGLHARAAALFVQTASTFEARVTVRHGDRTTSGKSIMGLMTLAAPKGTTLVVEADGPDAPEAVGAIGALIADRFQEEA